MLRKGGKSWQPNDDCHSVEVALNVHEKWKFPLRKAASCYKWQQGPSKPHEGYILVALEAYNRRTPQRKEKKLSALRFQLVSPKTDMQSYNSLQHATKYHTEYSQTTLSIAMPAMCLMHETWYRKRRKQIQSHQNMTWCCTCPLQGGRQPTTWTVNGTRVVHASTRCLC